jgi:hypothetical protein
VQVQQRQTQPFSSRAVKACRCSNCAPPLMISCYVASQPARPSLADAVGRLPSNSTLPELARAKALLA